MTTSISLSDFLREDTRPTVLFKEADDVASAPSGAAAQWTLAYTNPVYDNFLASLPRYAAASGSDHATFLQEVESADDGRFDFGGYRWRTRYLQGHKWRIVYCEDELDESMAHDLSASGMSGSSYFGATKENLMPRHPRESSIASSPESSASDSTARTQHRSLSAKSSLTDFGAGREMIDFTQHDVPGLSAYIQRFKNIKWSDTILGPMSTWSLSLRQAVVKMLLNPEPRVLIWGPHFIILYNESCCAIIGEKHPAALGRPPAIAFAELWPMVMPLVTAAYHHGKPTSVEKMELLMNRREDVAFEEETYFSFTMLPILGADGTAAGVIDEFTEVTNATIAERRVRTILRAGEHSASAEGLQDVWQAMLKALDENTHDVPFAMIYSVKNSDGDEFSSKSSETASQAYHSATEKYCWLEGVVGIDQANESAFPSFLLTEGDDGFARECREAWRKRVPFLIEEKAMPLGLVQTIPGRNPYVRAVVCAIQPSYGTSILGFLVLGLNGRRPWNDAYRDFIRLLTDRINTCTAHVVLPREQREAQAATEEAALRHSSLTKQLLLRTQEAERSEANFMRIAAFAAFGMFVLKSDGSPTYLNEAFYDLTGVKKSDIEFQFKENFWSKTIHPHDLEHVRESWAKMTRDRQPIVFEYRGIKPWSAIDKATNTEMMGDFWIRAMAFPEVDTTDDNVVGMQGWLENISLQKYTERMQQNKLEQALEHKRQSEAFIDMTSHEIRNPLSAIVLSADSVVEIFKENTTRSPMLLNNDEAEEILNAAQTVILCANHQRKLCSDILTLSKLDANLLSISPDRTNPVFLVNKALRMYAAELQNASIDAKLSIDDSLERLEVEDVILDSSRLLQVLINLLTNAIKFTKDRPRREIEISVSASIEKPMSEAHGVSFIKPRETTRDKQAVDPEWAGLPTVYIQFAVEDTGRGLSDAEMRILFTRFSQASPKTYGQYGGSGLGLFISRELSELSGGQIGVSSMANRGSIFAFYVAALKLPPNPKSPKTAPAHLRDTLATPPKELAEPPLPAIVASLLPVPQPPAMPIRTSSAPPLPQIGHPPLEVPRPRTPEVMHVLVVEDNLINQKIMAQQLRRQGCIVDVASHGLEALAFLKSTVYATNPVPDPARPPTTSPPSLSIILLDLEMPIMDGLTCIRHIRDMERQGELTGHVPVIAVTANARSEQIANALGQGMDQVITKPFRIPDLLGQMKSLVAGTLMSPVTTGAGALEARATLI